MPDLKNMTVSDVRPYRLDPFDNHSKQAYEDAYYLGCDDIFNEDVTIHENDDNDHYQHYYRLKFEDSGRVNFYIDWDDDSKIDLYVFDKDGLKLGKESSSTIKVNKKNKRRYRGCYCIDVVQDEEYLIGIEVDSIEGSRVEYHLKARLYNIKSKYRDMMENTLGLDYDLNDDYKFYDFNTTGYDVRNVIERKDEGTDVAHLQRSLYKLEYFDNEIDGVFDSITEDAVEDFQNDNSLRVDGEVGSKTKKALENKLKVKRNPPTNLGILTVGPDIHKPPFKVGEDILFGIKVKNYSDVSSPKYKIAVYDKNSNRIAISEEEQPSISSDRTYTTYMPISMNKDGRHKLIFRIEMDSEDTDMDNNEVSVYYEWKGKKGDIEEVLNKFPSSYRNKLRSILEDHPTWEFEPENLDFYFNSFIDAEMKSGHVCTPESKYGYTPKWRDPKYGYDPGYYAASREAVEYFIDPRNFLTEKHIFQFLSATPNAASENLEAIKKVLKGTKLEKYAQSFLEAAEFGINPIFLAAKARIESGGGTSTLARGAVEGYKGWYNVYGIGATDGQALVNGAKTAKKYGWNTIEKAITGGGKWILDHYVNIGQDRLYCMKWNITSYEKKGRVEHQYATHIKDAYNKASRFATPLKDINTSFTFKIPIFKSMPNNPCAEPLKAVPR
ncbi:peptidoglycan-binding protein [Wukongibacter sp. M2B1]|uniref:peptidoglycan-binding protein n=1 Tax=Wukongibacter sp. M2B1 TaxID=3088895 RepID=UPI003D794374